MYGLELAIVIIGFLIYLGITIMLIALVIYALKYMNRVLSPKGKRCNRCKRFRTEKLCDCTNN